MGSDIDRNKKQRQTHQQDEEVTPYKAALTTSSISR